MLIRERAVTGMRMHLAHPYSMITGWLVYTAKFFSRGLQSWAKSVKYSEVFYLTGSPSHGFGTTRTPPPTPLLPGCSETQMILLDFNIVWRKYFKLPVLLRLYLETRNGNIHYLNSFVQDCSSVGLLRIYLSQVPKSKCP